MRFLYQRPFTIRATRRMSDERSCRISLIKRIGNTLDRENAECPREDKKPRAGFCIDSTINRIAILGQLAWEMGAANGEQVTKLPKSDEQVAAGEAVRA